MATRSVALNEAGDTDALRALVDIDRLLQKKCIDPNPDFDGSTLELAEEIHRVSPASERLRFCASGTEATMYCQRLAKAFTGREIILKFEDAYHGANEVGDVESGEG